MSCNEEEKRPLAPSPPPPPSPSSDLIYTVHCRKQKSGIKTRELGILLVSDHLIGGYIKLNKKDPVSVTHPHISLNAIPNLVLINFPQSRVKRPTKGLF